MGSTNRLKDGLAILRAIAQSDALRDVRERLREGAMAIAESERVPRVVSASAGIVAALLDEPAEVYGRPDTPSEGVDSWSVGQDAQAREGEFADPEDAEPAPESYDEFEPDEAASLRDLEDADGVEEKLLGVLEPERDDEDDAESPLLRFDTPEAEVEAQASPEAALPLDDKQPARAAGARKGAKTTPGTAGATASNVKKAASKQGKAQKGAAAKASRTSKPARPAKGQRNPGTPTPASSARPPARRAPRKK